jgi:hypothetical protein
VHHAQRTEAAQCPALRRSSPTPATSPAAAAGQLSIITVASMARIGKIDGHYMVPVIGIRQTPVHARAQALTWMVAVWEEFSARHLAVVPQRNHTDLFTLYFSKATVDTLEQYTKNSLQKSHISLPFRQFWYQKCTQLNLDCQEVKYRIPCENRNHYHSRDTWISHKNCANLA